MTMKPPTEIIYLTLFLVLLEIHNIQAYRKYYVEDECTSPDEFQKVFFRLPAIGPDSVGELRSNRFGTYSRTGRKCLIKLIPPKGYGVLVTVLRVDFRNHKECEDYIKIDNNNGSERLCGLKEVGRGGKTFFSDREIVLRYHTIPGGLGFSKGFRLIFTVTKLDDYEVKCVAPDEFQCQNSHCIWAGVTCDGINNCGDGSDENSVAHPHCNDVTPVAIAAVILGIVSFIAVLILMCLCCCRPQPQGSKKKPLPENVPLRRNAGYIPLPGYTYGAVNHDAPYQQPIHSPLIRASAPVGHLNSCLWSLSAPYPQEKTDINYNRPPPPPYTA